MVNIGRPNLKTSRSLGGRSSSGLKIASFSYHTVYTPTELSVWRLSCENNRLTVDCKMILVYIHHQPTERKTNNSPRFTFSHQLCLPVKHRKNERKKGSAHPHNSNSPTWPKTGNKRYVTQNGSGKSASYTAHAAKSRSTRTHEKHRQSYRRHQARLSLGNVFLRAWQRQTLGRKTQHRPCVLRNLTRSKFLHTHTHKHTFFRIITNSSSFHSQCDQHRSTDQGDTVSRRTNTQSRHPLAAERACSSRDGTRASRTAYGRVHQVKARCADIRRSSGAKDRPAGKGKN